MEQGGRTCTTQIFADLYLTDCRIADTFPPRPKNHTVKRPHVTPRVGGFPMRLCSITPVSGGLELRVYRIGHAADSSDKKSFGVTAPSVTSRMRRKCSSRGMRPATYREIAACSTPIISPNFAWEIALLDKNSDSFITRTYQHGMETQEPHTNAVLDFKSERQYRIGMNTLRQRREKLNLSQAKFAAELGTQQSQVSRWEKPYNDPKHRWPTMQWAIKLGQLFGVPGTIFLPKELAGNSLDQLLADSPPEIREAVYQAAIHTLIKSAKEAG